MSEDAAAWPRPEHGTGEEEGHPPCLTLDHSGQRALVRGRAVPLTRTEALVLRVLLEARGRTVAVGDILALAWDGEEGRSGKVRIVVARLRQRLGDARMIETIGGEGCRLVNASELIRSR